MRYIPLLIFLGLCACDAKKPDWAEKPEARALPQQLCSEVKKGLDALKSRGADYTDRGELTIAEPAWRQMTGEQHDQLVRGLAYRASCVAGSESDAQTVVVRSDTGEQLTQRSVSTRIDTSDLTRE